MEKAEVMTAAIKTLFIIPMVVGLFCDQPLFAERTSFEEIVSPDAANSRYNLTGMEVPGEKDFSVQAFGMDGGQVISKHARLITLDDVVTFENSRTPAELKRIEEKYFVDVDRAANPDAQLNLLGYRHHPGDLYKKLSRLEDFAGRYFDDVPFQLPNGKSSWPERYPDEYVAKKLRSLPPILAAAMYQQNDKLMAGDIIKYDWLRFYKDPNRVKLLPVVIGVDLATSQKESADYCAFCVLAYDSETKEFFEIEMIYGRFTFDERLKIIARLALKYRGRLQKIGIEKPASGSDIAAILKREAKLRVEAVTLTKDKVSRLIMNQHIFQQGRIYFWGPEDRPDFESLKRFRQDDMEEVGTLIEELLAWKADQQPPPPVHDDRTDALVICLHLWGEDTAGDALKALEDELEKRNKQIAESLAA